jgi:hypothetical protein
MIILSLKFLDSGDDSVTSHTATVVEETLIDSAIPAAKFACDLSRCKGGCCTRPGYLGAPLLDEELEEIEKAFPVVRKYLSYRHRDTIEERGMFQGRPGEHTTQVIDRRACVFVVVEHGIAKCAFEKAYLNNEITWRKPISCHLFPIRIDRGTPTRLRYEQIAECRPAVERGEREKLPLVQFLEPSLVGAFGKEWYAELLAHCRRKQEGTSD